MNPPSSSNAIATIPPRGPVGPGADACRDPAIIEGYVRDASGRSGYASALFRPTTEAELADVLRRASESGESVTVVAGQTSTTASSVPRGGWIVSVERLNRVLEIDREGRRARAEAGVGLGRFQDEIEASGLLYPPDPTSRYECSLGGSVACNASGPRSLRYGSTRRWVQGARVVLASGEVLALRRGEVVAGDLGYFEVHCIGGPRDGRTTRIPVPQIVAPAGVKHAAGFTLGPEHDLLDCFIGSEGTLGVLSEVEVALAPRPEGWLSLLAFFADEDDALSLVESQRFSTRARPQCLEFFDAAALDLLRADAPHFEVPESARVALYIEAPWEGGDGGDDEEGEGDPIGPDELAEHWMGVLSDHGALVDLGRGVVVAQTAEQHEALRIVRHAVPVGVNERAAARGMPKLGTDLAVPDAALREICALYHQAADDPRGLLDEAEQRSLIEDLGVGRSTEEPVDRAAWHAAGLPDGLDAVSFGHIGDNHVHVNFLPRDDAELALARAVYAHLTRRAIALGGTPSAEHGIGKIKHAALRTLVGEAGIAQMRAVKRALDPTSCLGRGNLFEIEGVAEARGID